MIPLPRPHHDTPSLMGLPSSAHFFLRLRWSALLAILPGYTTIVISSDYINHMSLQAPQPLSLISQESPSFSSFISGLLDSFLSFFPLITSPLSSSIYPLSFHYLLTSATSPFFLLWVSLPHFSIPSPSSLILLNLSSSFLPSAPRHITPRQIQVGPHDVCVRVQGMNSPARR